MGGAHLPAISISQPNSHTNFLLKSRESSTIPVPRRNSSPTTTAVQFHAVGFSRSSEVHGYGSSSSRKHWDKFYERHNNKFFKDRHYLEKDWGHYFSDENTTSLNRKVILEAGCGAGNTIFPLLTKYPHLFIHACDFSHQAIELVKSNTKFCEDRMNVFVCNIAEDDLSGLVMPSSVDVVTLIFTLSAMSPEKMPSVIENVRSVLKPNGHVLLRDYALGDYAQVMLQKRNQIISENFYFRGDGTSSFYFSEDFLSDLFIGAGFAMVDVNIYNRDIENRSQNITMPRRWIRAVFSRL